MATNAPITGAPTRAPFIPAPPAAITRALSRFDREQLSGFITVAIDLLDFADGDPDLEDNCDHEATDGDDKDVSWLEWQGRKTPPNLPASRQNEDDEEDDEDACMAGDDDPTRRGDAGEDVDGNDEAWPEAFEQGYNLAASSGGYDI